MDHLICSEIRASLAALFADRVDINTLARYCVVTLPLKTVDQRNVSLVVEQGLGDKLIVHDGGKTDSSLFSQGVNVSDARLTSLRKVASRYGVSISSDRMIQKMCGLDALNAAIMDVAQCTILTSQEIAGHRVVLEDENITHRLKATFKDWHPQFVDKVVYRVEARGETAMHNFPFVVFPVNARDRTVALKILHSSHAQWQAERYGFLVHDLRGRPFYQDWFKVAVLARSDEWPKRAIELVKSLTANVVEIPTGTESELVPEIPTLVGKLMRAA